MDYHVEDDIAVLTLDDGKVNAVGHALLDYFNEGLDKAEADGSAALVIRGREGMFSAGFDLKEFARSAEAGISMVERGIELLIRLYGYPLPVVVACSGHGIAMGAFIILACDTRIGTRGDFRITLPETAISMEIPGPMRALTLSRLSPRFLTRAAIQSEVFAPDDAVTAGFLDEVVEAAQLDERAMAAARTLAQLPGEFYARNKLFARAHVIREMEDTYAQAQTKMRA